MALEHDGDGFLTGNRIDLRRVVDALSAIQSDVRAIRQALSTGAVARSRGRAADRSTRPAVATPAGRDSRGRFASGSTAAQSAAATPAGRSGGIPGAPGAASGPGAVPPARDGGGRFSRDRTGSSGGGDPEAASSIDSSYLRSVGDRIAGAVTGAAGGLEEADPAVRSFKEIALPLARGYQLLRGDGGKRQEGWLKKILAALTKKRPSTATRTNTHDDTGPAESGGWGAALLVGGVGAVAGLLGLLSGGKTEAITGAITGAVGGAWDAVKSAASSAADWVLGRTSKAFESGAGGAGTVSSGSGDHGGASYGTYQMSSSQGTVQSFLKASGYGAQFSGLTPGSDEFNSKWKALASSDPAFGVAQHDFIKSTHYNPQIAKLQGEGIDLSGRGAAVQDAVWSTAVQFGGRSSVIRNALAGKDAGSMSDADIVSAIQDYKASNNDRLFASSSDAVRASTLNRASAEKDRLLSLAASVAPAAPAISSIPAPAAPTIPTPQSIPSTPPVSVPLASAGGRAGAEAGASSVDVGQDISDRPIAHIVTGGLNGAP